MQSVEPALRLAGIAAIEQSTEYKGLVHLHLGVDEMSNLICHFLDMF